MDFGTTNPWLQQAFYFRFSYHFASHPIPLLFMAFRFINYIRLAFT
jgi:hypothetical protein